MSFRVVLVEPEHEGNVGSIVRLMKNFDVSKLWLVNPKVKIGNEAYARAVHAGEILDNAVMVENVDRALAGVDWVVGTTAIAAKKPSNLRRTTITPTELAKQIMNKRLTVALLFGREGHGLTNKELGLCDVVVTIPSSSAYRTLNVAAASAILFYELWKARTDVNKRGFIENADVSTVKRLLQIFNALIVKGNLPMHKRRLANKAFKNVISRAFISKREAFLILGVLSRALNLTIK